MKKIINEQSITSEILLKNEWIEDDTLRKFEGFEDYRSFEKNVNNEWFITLTYLLTNSVSRDWNCHIDNSIHESIASVDIQTIEHFNQLMNLMDIDYQL